MSKQERFYLPARELRSTTDSKGSRIVEGTIPYNSPSSGLPWIETIAPGAFASALKPGVDVLALRDHNPTNLLGRTLSGTLVLTDSPEGLQYRIALPNTSVANDLVESLARKDITGTSFGFVVEPNGDAWGQDAAGNLTRSLNSIQCFEISVTSFPAFPESEANLRSAVPAEFRPLLKFSKRSNANDCTCDCEECQGNNCPECSNEDDTCPECIDCPNQDDGDDEERSPRLNWSERTLLRLEVLSRL